MKDYRLYKYTNIVNNKVYIGITRLNERDRAGKNGTKYKVCPAFWAGIQEFGWDKFLMENIASGLSREQAEEMEREYIEKCQSNVPEYGYNIQSGGSHLYGDDNMFYGKTHNNETRSLIAKSNKGRIWTEEARRAVSEKAKHRSPCKRIECVETGIIYESVVKASAETKISKSMIYAAARGEVSKAGNYHWKYI